MHSATTEPTNKVGADSWQAATRKSSTIRPLLQLERIQENTFPAYEPGGFKDWLARSVAAHLPFSIK